MFLGRRLKIPIFSISHVRFNAMVERHSQAPFPSHDCCNKCTGYNMEYFQGEREIISLISRGQNRCAATIEMDGIHS